MFFKKCKSLSLQSKPTNSLFSTSTFHSFLSSLPRNLTLSQSKQLHARLLLLRLASNPSLIGHLLSFLAVNPSLTRLDYPFLVYKSIGKPNVYAVNNMIRCFVKSERPLESVDLYLSMMRSGIRANNYSFTFVLQGCGKGFGLLEGVQVHGHVIKLGFCDDVFVRNALTHLYFACCRIESARRVFEERLGCGDVVTWNVMLAGFARDGQVGLVEKLFDEMPERDVVSWNTMIMAYVHNGKFEEGMKCFERMRESGLSPNEATLVMMLSLAAQMGVLEYGCFIHSEVDSLDIPLTVTLGTALLDMYAKCGCIDKCKILFEILPMKDISTWNVMICGLASHGLGKEAILLFERFLNEGLVPANVTFIGVLNACSRAGLVTEGREYFKLMTTTYGIKPEMEHYGCMVDLLGRAGLVSEAVEMVENEVASPSPVLWATLLCACRIHGLVELGEKIGTKLLELDPTYDGHYVQLASIYAKSSKWEDVHRVRRLMAERVPCKVAGWSLIEARGFVHKFIAGDTEHPQALEIQKILEMIEARLAEIGYVPDIASVQHDIGEEEKEHAVKVHSERLAIAFSFLVTKPGECIRIVKNLRVCWDCHEVTKMISKCFQREIIVRDGSRFHEFKEGKCSCNDFW